MRKLFLFFFLFISLLGQAQLQNWVVAPPVNPVTTLSGSFAELRRNHFHGGLDFRTGGAENKPVYAISDGYVSRITISARSYGKLVYITHPNGYTTLYAHLNGFVPELDSIVKAKQYEKRSFEIDLILSPTDYPVKKGEQFAISGNTGSSGGPHLHFEVRKTEDNSLQNPLKLNQYFKIQDNKKPRIFAVKLYGLNGGSVDNLSEKRFNTIMTKTKEKTLRNGNNIKAWGDVGFSVKANDYMTGTGFTHTPRNMKVYVDKKLISNIYIDNIKFSDSRALNSLIDYPQYSKNGEFFIKSFCDQNHPLTIYCDAYNEGKVRVDQERDYKVKYEVIDDFGHVDSISFTIHGVKTELKPVVHNCENYLAAGENHFFDKKDFLAFIPADATYYDFIPDYQEIPTTKYYSKIFHFGDEKMPLHTFCDITLKVERDSAIQDKRKLFIAKLTPNNLIWGSAGGKYEKGFLVGKTREFGKFAVAVDNTKPIITPVHTNGLTRYPVLVFKIADGLSGIAQYDGYVDGQWVLFEHDAKTRTIRYRMDPKRVEKNKNHTFKLVVTDFCGNSSTYEKNIFW